MSLSADTTLSTSNLKFSDELILAIEFAQNHARRSLHETFSPAHLLKGLLHEDVGLHPILELMDKEIAKLNKWADFRIDRLSKSTRALEEPMADGAVKATIKEAEKIRSKKFVEDILPVHVLEALTKPGVAYESAHLKRFPIAYAEFQDAKEREDVVNDVLQTNGTGGEKKSPKRLSKALDKYCEDLTQQAREDKIDPVKGRDRELKRLIEILSKRLSPNVLIVGEPGVGKTALVGGLAINILADKVPADLKNATIFELDVNGSLVAGAYKGEVEERLKSTLKAIKQFDGKAILFIDEIHVLLDEKSAVGSGAVNLLKPELARGELTVIGATTVAEYKRFIESDQAFSRRFSLLNIDEPSTEVAFEMLQGIVPKFVEKHGIDLGQSVISESIRLAKRYYGDSRLPSSAIQLLDRTMAALKVMNEVTVKEVLELEDHLEGLLTEGREFGTKVVQKFSQQIKDRLSHLIWNQIEVEEVGELVGFKSQLAALKEVVSTPRLLLNETDLAATISEDTGIPAGDLQSDEKEQLLDMEATLNKRVIGQDHALKIVSQTIRRSRAGLKEANKPVGVFFFIGPTGTGKTELAKSIAQLLFNDENAVVRFDMSEFKEKHSAELLLGAPPGYVGYEEGGLLVNKIRQKPYSVVLFDEIEKAHPSVFDIFLQIMDEGNVHDKLNKRGDFSHSIIIFTSNLGSEWIVDRFNQSDPPEALEMREFLQSLKKFRPEFLGRRMNLIPFAPITEDIATSILGIHLNKFKKLLNKQEVDLQLSDKAISSLVEKGFSPMYGARPLKDIIENLLGTTIADKIISGEVEPGETIHLDIGDDEAFEWMIKKTN